MNRPADPRGPFAPSNCEIIGPPGVEETAAAAKAYVQAKADWMAAARNMGYLLRRARMVVLGKGINQYIDGLMQEIAPGTDELVIMDRWVMAEALARAFTAGRASRTGHQ